MPAKKLASIMSGYGCQLFCWHLLQETAIIQMINYNGRRFRTAVNTENGEVSNETIFNYYQQNQEIWADYSGGSVVRGSIIGKVNEEGIIDMVYHHLSETGELRAGKCHSVPEIMKDGKIRLHESWQWTSGDASSGQSIIEEF